MFKPKNEHDYANVTKTTSSFFGLRKNVTQATESEKNTLKMVEDALKDFGGQLSDTVTVETLKNKNDKIVIDESATFTFGKN